MYTFPRARGDPALAVPRTQLQRFAVASPSARNGFSSDTRTLDILHASLQSCLKAYVFPISYSYT